MNHAETGSGLAFDQYRIDTDPKTRRWFLTEIITTQGNTQLVQDFPVHEYDFPDTDDTSTKPLLYNFIQERRKADTVIVFVNDGICSVIVNRDILRPSSIKEGEDDKRPFDMVRDAMFQLSEDGCEQVIISGTIKKTGLPYTAKIMFVAPVKAR